MKLFYLPRAFKLPLVVIITLLCKVNAAYSQASNIVPDNTLGDESSQVIENADGQPKEVITGGAQRGQNLFHSFQEFNVGEGREASFANPEAVNNIFSRVTGGNPSNILGVLGVNGAANLYLINPNGILFGANSSLNVQGSFTATTANGIRFGEQGEFNTVNPQAPELLTINPSAYLFNQIGDGDINDIESQGSLQVPEGENIVLLGGDINLKGLLITLGGTVSLGSVNDTGEIAIGENSNLIFTDEIARGDISLSDGSFIIVPTVPTAGEGSINVYSQNLNLTQGSRMVTGIFQNLGDSDIVGGDVVVDVLGTVSLDDSSISNTIAENAEGTTGKIEVEAESVVLRNGGYISTDTLGRGDGGDININATESVIVDGENSDGFVSRISSDILFSEAEGNAGDIEINTGSLEVTNGGFITSSIFGTGDGGDININATESVIVDGERSDVQSSQISNIILPEVEENGVDITITVTELVIVDGENSVDGSAKISSNVIAEGNAGNIEINTGSLRVTDGGLISSDIVGIGEGGNININATELMEVDGEKSDGLSSRISSDIKEGAQGNAGDIEITTGLLELKNGGLISSDIVGIGEGGNININATELMKVDGQRRDGSPSRISSIIFPQAQGKAGDTTITTDSLRVTNGGLILSETFGIGDGGNITINATELMEVDGENSDDRSSRISSSVREGAEGNAGYIEITTGLLRVTDGGRILSNIVGRGDGGNITITATESVEVDGENSDGDSSQISSRVFSQGEGKAGDTTITTNSLRVTNGGLILNDILGIGEAGNININANESVVVDGERSNQEYSRISSDVGEGAQGNAGELKITTGSLRVTNGGLISSSIFGKGEGGDINITATELMEVDGEKSDGLSSRISTTVFSSDAQGNAGNIKINTGSLRVTNGGFITSDIVGRGDGGDITITETESVEVDGERSDEAPSRISSIIFPDAQGNAGELKITTGSLKLTNGGDILTNTDGRGDGGDISITATESVVVNDENSDEAPSRISSDVGERAEGNSGNIKITTGSLDVTNGGLITTNTLGKGDGGNITITATESVVVNGENSDEAPSRISSDVGERAEGNSGNIEITTGSLEVINGNLITSNTFGRGDGGNITITATELAIVRGKSNVLSQILSDVREGAEGNAGKITITTPSLETNRGVIGSGTFGNGNAGEIVIDADFVLLGEDSAISTTSGTAGKTGNITLNVSDTLMLNDGFINNNSPIADGGDITIVAGDIRLRGDSDIAASSGTNLVFVTIGNDGGNITITADSIIAFDDSDIFAFARDGEGGDITLNTPVFFGENFTSNSLSNPEFLENNSRADINATGVVSSGAVSLPDVSFIQNSLSELPDNSIDTDELLANSCVVPAGDRGQGRFIITGGESLPVRPGDSKPSKYPTGEVRNLPDNNNSWNGDRIVEPQGMYRLTNGQLVLSRECQ